MGAVAVQEVDEAYQKLSTLRDNFTLRDKVLNSGLLEAVALILTSGKNVSFQQKRRFLIKKIFNK